MRFKSNFLASYLNEAPVSLAFERAFECHILSQQTFERPILDIGCGDGIFARILFDEKIDVGVDPLEYELASAKTYDVYNELILAFGNKIPKSDSSFKTIFSNSVLEHIEDLDPVLDEVNRLLVPGGRFYATIPTNYFEKYSIVSQMLNGLGLKKLALKFNKFFNHFWKHYHFYDRQGWINKFTQRGFKVVEIIEYGRSNDCLFNDMMVPVSLPNYIVKKSLNRWFLARSFRKIYSPVWLAILNSRVKVHPGLNTGGLIFFSLTK